MTRASKYVALLPAAGTGSRLPDRKLSKELVRFGGGAGEGRPAISHLLGCIADADVRDIVVVLREGKKDIEEYLSGDEWQRLRFSYRITPGTSGVPETVMLGLDDNRDAHVVFGFPDILFTPVNAIGQMIRQLESTDVDVVLGLFPTDNPSKMDMVRTNHLGQVIGIEIKPEQTELPLTWILAVWKPTFSDFLIRLVRDDPDRLEAQARGFDGSHLGHAFQLALASGLAIDATEFDDGRSLDIGTPEDLALAQTWSI